MAYIEPAPLKDRENPFEAMMSRFQEASQILGLEDEIYSVLKNPTRQVIVSLPVTMDDGTIRFCSAERASQNQWLARHNGVHRHPLHT